MNRPRDMRNLLNTINTNVTEDEYADQDDEAEQAEADGYTEINFGEDNDAVVDSLNELLSPYGLRIDFKDLNIDYAAYVKVVQL